MEKLTINTDFGSTENSTYCMLKHRKQCLLCVQAQKIVPTVCSSTENSAYSVLKHREQGLPCVQAQKTAPTAWSSTENSAYCVLKHRKTAPTVCLLSGIGGLVLGTTRGRTELSLFRR